MENNLQSSNSISGTFIIVFVTCNLLVTSKVQGGSRILFLDGGGMRGLIQIEILAMLEKCTGRQTIDLFDWIIGTSTGGIVALGLVYGNYLFVA